MTEPTPGPHRVYVHLGAGLDAQAYHERFLQGRETDDWPYGFSRAREVGCEVVFSRDAPESAGVRLLRRALRRILGFDLWHAWRNRARWRDCEAIWTVQDSEWLAIAALGALGLPHPPLIANTIWLFDRWPRLGPLRRGLARLLAPRADVLTVHSQPLCESGARCLPGSRPRLLRFGIAVERFTPGPAPEPDAADLAPVPPSAPRPLRLFAPGSDPTRDWPTLLEAFGADPRFELVLLTPRLPPGPLGARHPAARVEHWQGLAQLRSLYAACDLVVIPMRPNGYAGITVALEATAMGRAVLSSRTGGVGTYLAEDEAFWAHPGDAAALRDAALATRPQGRQDTVERAQARLARDAHSTRGMVARYLALTRSVSPRAGH